MINILTATKENQRKAYEFMAIRSLPGPSILLAIYFTIIFVTPFHDDHQTLSYVFGGLLLLICGTRTYNDYHFSKFYQHDPVFWKSSYHFLVTTTSLIWGVFCAVVIHFYSISLESLLLLVCTAGVSAISVITLVPLPKLSNSYQVFLTLPTIIYSLTVASPQAYAVSGLFTAYLVFMTLMARRLQHDYWLSVQNSNLLDIRAKELEQARDTAIQLANTKSQFLATMSHEIRTPMNGILGMSQLLEETNLDNNQKDYVDTIYQSTRSLLDIVNDILDFSKLESGKLQLEVMPFNLAKMCDDILKLFRAKLDNKKLNFSTQIDPSIPPVLSGDPGKLRQILINLVGNAVKFSDTGTIRLNIIKKSPTNNGIQLSFEVIDDGIGIDLSENFDLFGSFVQADNSTTRNYGGTGLGLSICKQLVTLMDGEIHVSSDIGKGSKFWFEIELAVSEALNESKNTTSANDTFNLPGINVLLVEDNQANIIYAKTLLEKLSIHVDIANDGEEAISYFNENLYDLILMDCEMPIMNGFDAAKHIRDIESSMDRKTPIIAVTANSQQINIDQSIKAGMNDYLCKPYTKVELINLLKKWIINHKSTNIAPIHDAQNHHIDAIGPLDLDKIEELKETMEEEFDNLLLTYINSTESILTKIDYCIDNNEVENMRMYTHSLKSASANLGAIKLSEHAKKLENQICNKNQPISATQLQTLSSEFDTVKVQLQKFSSR